MSWAPTGTNNVPLGRRSRIPGASNEVSSPPPMHENGHSAAVDVQAGLAKGFDAQGAVERARAIANSVLGITATQPSQPQSHVPPPMPAAALAAAEDRSDAGERKRRRRNRWGAGDGNTAASAALTSGMTKEQVESYATVLRIDEITRRLKSGDVVPPDGQRSPSPPPTYNSEGKRTNTREHRYRRKLEEERMRLVEEQLRRDPDYRPPSDYRRRSRFSEKVFIPVEENPGLNFIGLLIGPRGNTLKKIESDSGTKISIRGKGSIKEGKRRDDTNIPGADEDLHCHIVADSEEKIKRGVRLVLEIIQKACSTPEGQNILKRSQLRELAALNGTLRDDEGHACTNCGALEHRTWECPDTANVTVSMVCPVCNKKGHLARDCSQRHDPDALQRARERDQQLNSEYLDLMAELGESLPTASARADSVRSDAAGRAAGERRRPSISGHGDSTQPSSGMQSPPAQPPWQRDARSPAGDHRRRSRSPLPRRPLARPSTPPWIRRRPADRYYANGFRDPRPVEALKPPHLPPANHQLHTGTEQPPWVTQYDYTQLPHGHPPPLPPPPPLLQHPHQDGAANGYYEQYYGGAYQDGGQPHYPYPPVDHTAYPPVQAPPSLPADAPPPPPPEDVPPPPPED
ncbi:hypothetical protein H4R20_003928, partial [Coemansia guatemalensis]